MLLRRHREIAATAGRHEKQHEQWMMRSRGDESQVPAKLRADWRYWKEQRDASWRRLDEPERIALAAFGACDGQLSVRESFYRKKGGDAEQFAVLDGRFVDSVFDWLEVPALWRPRAWDGIQVLHDLKWQDGREHPSLCWHVDAPLALCYDKRRGDGLLWCVNCSQRFRCRVCWLDGVWHGHGS